MLLDELDGRVINVRVAPTIIVAFFLPALFLLARSDGINTVSPRLLNGANMPFAKVACGVALLFQQFGDGDVVRKAAVRGVGRIRRRKLRGHQPRARRAAGGTRGVELPEARAVAREGINVRRTRIRMPVAMQVAAAKIVHEEENDVGLQGVLVVGSSCVPRRQTKPQRRQSRGLKKSAPVDGFYRFIHILSRSFQFTEAICQMLQIRAERARRCR